MRLYVNRLILWISTRHFKRCLQNNEKPDWILIFFRPDFNWIGSDVWVKNPAGTPASASLRCFLKSLKKYFAPIPSTNKIWNCIFICRDYSGSYKNVLTFVFKYTFLLQRVFLRFQDIGEALFYLFNVKKCSPQMIWWPTWSRVWKGP